MLPRQRQEQEKIYAPADHQRHYVPIDKAMPLEQAQQFSWTREQGSIQTYQHHENQRLINIDHNGQFFNRHLEPIARDEALFMSSREATKM